MTKTKKISTANLVEGLTLIEVAVTTINQISNVYDKTTASLACGLFYKASSCFGKVALTPQEANLAEYSKTYPQAIIFLEAICSLAKYQKNKEIMDEPKNRLTQTFFRLCCLFVFVQCRIKIEKFFPVWTVSFCEIAFKL